MKLFQLHLIGADSPSAVIEIVDKVARVVSVIEDGGKIRLKQLGLASIGGRTGEYMGLALHVCVAFISSNRVGR